MAKNHIVRASELQEFMEKQELQLCRGPDRLGTTKSMAYLVLKKQYRIYYVLHKPNNAVKSETRHFYQLNDAVDFYNNL